MLVYRLETLKGTGVYCSGASFSGYDIERHPGPSRDGGDLEVLWNTADRKGHYRFAFASMEQFRKWFSYEMCMELIKYNKSTTDVLALYIYDCPDHEVKIGNSQCVFVKNSSQKVRSYSIEEAMEGMVPTPEEPEVELNLTDSFITCTTVVSNSVEFMSC